MRGTTSGRSMIGIAFVRGFLWPGACLVLSPAPGHLMDRRDYVLAVLAAADGASLGPVQVQKLFFLLDERIPELVGGPHFDFKPCAYGPFDARIYHDLDALARSELVEISTAGFARFRTYRATPAGQTRGSELLGALPDNAAAYIRKLSEWVRSLSFASLVSAIYQAYPAMRANSVFRDAA